VTIVSALSPSSPTLQGKQQLSTATLPNMPALPPLSTTSQQLKRSHTPPPPLPGISQIQPPKLVNSHNTQAVTVRRPNSDASSQQQSSFLHAPKPHVLTVPGMSVKSH